ncbi:hypothetical protein F5146DRAFT_1031660 [Armillaria mellea]|nr:hypothetical protein F5146DRAFT_1031660 [Armillaria mellea]
MSRYDFKARVRRMFEKNRNLTDDAEIEKAIKFGEYIKEGGSLIHSIRQILIEMLTL